MKVCSIVFNSLGSSVPVYNYRYDDKRFTLAEGDLVVVPANDSYKIVTVVEPDVTEVSFKGKLKLMVDKIDMDSYADQVLEDDRIQKLEAELKKERAVLENLAKETLNLNWLASMAESDPALKARFDAYNAKLKELK